MEKLKEKYQNEYERHLDTYQTKKEALIKEGLLSENLNFNLLSQLRLNLSRMLEPERKERP